MSRRFKKSRLIVNAHRRACRKARYLTAQLADSLRLIMDTRPERCHDTCKGWFINQERMTPERCDECAHLNGYQDNISDDDIAMLPEVDKERRLDIRRLGAEFRSQMSQMGAQ